MRGPEEWLSTTEPGLPASFTLLRRGQRLSAGRFGMLSSGDDGTIYRNCLIFKHNYLMRYFQYAQYPIVFIDLFRLQ